MLFSGQAGSGKSTVCGSREKGVFWDKQRHYGRILRNSPPFHITHRTA